MKVMDKSQELKRQIVTTLNKGAQNSPASDSAKKIGRNAAAVVRDATSNGILSSREVSTAASLGVFPSDILTIVDSQTTIPLSTNNPNEIINEAKET